MNDSVKKLQLGCGPGLLPEDWVNLDGSWNAFLGKHPVLRICIQKLQLFPSSLLDVPWSDDVVVHDLRRPLPFPDQTFTAIYGSHILEHLYLEQARALLAECLRVLRPGGFLRMVVPDLQAMVEKYIEGGAAEKGEPMRADILNSQLGFRNAAPPSGNVAFRIYSAVNDFHSHKWMYDSQSLIFYFESAGFVHVKSMKFLESRIDGIEAVEKEDRVLNGAGICVEGQCS
jgi:SAM-dependent methyltransferase